MEQRVISFDIETIPDESRIKDLPEVEAPKNLKDEKKIEAKKKELQDAQIQGMGLDPLWGQVAMFAWSDGKESGVVSLKDEGGEKELLERSWMILKDYIQFVTFNGINFDVPFIKFRSMVRNVKPTTKVSTRKFYATNHLDLMQILKGWDQYKKGRLDDYCGAILGTTKTEGVDGSKFYELWKDDSNHDLLKRYAQNDAVVTFNLYKAMKGYYI